MSHFLYRLSLSPHRECFVLRRAALFAAWVDVPHRPTRDLDLLATGDNSPDTLRAVLNEIFAWPISPPDGVIFLPETLVIEERTEGRVYQGLHLEVLAELGTARPRLDMDISFGEAITPGPAEIELPVMLGQPRPRLRAYPQETVIAEKTEALVSLGLGNTRLKDFFDLWYLSQSFAFDGPTLAAALHATFTRRGTPFPEGGLPEALTPRFSENSQHQSQWTGFVGNVGSENAPGSLNDFTEAVRQFLQPLLVALAADRPFPEKWTPGGPWNIP